VVEHFGVKGQSQSVALFLITLLRRHFFGIRDWQPSY
jgi:hypothetical protein